MKNTILLSFLIISSAFAHADWDKELNQDAQHHTGHMALGGITSAGGIFMIAKGAEKTIIGNTGCNYPASFIARSFRGTKTRCAGIILALAGLATYDLGATLLTQPAEGIKLYHQATAKTFKSIHSFFSFFTKQSKNNN